MTFRKCAAAAWFVVASFAVCAHATAAETSPSVIRGPVEYPASAVSAGEEGTVQVVAEVDVDGKAGDAKIYSSRDTGISTPRLCGALQDGRSSPERRVASQWRRRSLSPLVSS